MIRRCCKLSKSKLLTTEINTFTPTNVNPSSQVDLDLTLSDGREAKTTHSVVNIYGPNVAIHATSYPTIHTSEHMFAKNSGH